MTSARLETALKSVNDAFRRLEEAAAEKASQVEKAAAEQETALAHALTENNVLKEDNARLSNQLQALQKDFLKLQETALSTINRLDDSVKAIDRMLEH